MSEPVIEIQHLCEHGQELDHYNRHILWHKPSRTGDPVAEPLHYPSCPPVASLREDT